MSEHSATYVYTGDSTEKRRKGVYKGMGVYIGVMTHITPSMPIFDPFMA